MFVLITITYTELYIFVKKQKQNKKQNLGLSAKTAIIQVFKECKV